VPQCAFAALLFEKAPALAFTNAFKYLQGAAVEAAGLAFAVGWSLHSAPPVLYAIKAASASSNGMRTHRDPSLICGNIPSAHNSRTNRRLSEYLFANA